MEGSARDLLEYRKETAGKRTKLALVLLSLLALTAVWRITQGEWAIPLARVAELISPFRSGEDLASPEALVVRSVRLPRFLAAAGTGGLLAVSGVVLQGLLANPLAEPYTLGIASGAAFGGALRALARRRNRVAQRRRRGLHRARRNNYQRRALRRRDLP